MQVGMITNLGFMIKIQTSSAARAQCMFFITLSKKWENYKNNDQTKN